MTPEPTQAELDEIAKIYRQGAKDLAALLTRGTDFQRGKAAILLAQVDAISKRMGASSDTWVTATMRKKIEANAISLERTLSPVLQKLAGRQWEIVRPQFLRINERAVGVFARQLAADLAGKNLDLSNTARRLISTTRQRVLKDPELSAVIAKGLVSGGNLNKITAGLKARLAEGGRELLASGKYTATELRQICDFEAGYIQAGQCRFRIDDYAEMVAHYQLRQASTQSTKERLADLGERMGQPDAFDLVKVTGPAARLCTICHDIVGNVYSLSGRSEKYPPLADLPHGGPPFHPHCTHNLAPYIEALNDAWKNAA